MGMNPGGPRAILHVLNSASYLGANRSVATLLAHLDRRRYRPLAVLPGEGPMQDRLRRLDVPVVRLPLPSTGRFRGGQVPRLKAAARNTVNLARLVSLLDTEQVRLVHTSTVFPLGGALAARVAGVPHIWHLREGLDLPDYDLRFGRRATRHLLGALSDVPICISDYVRRVSLPPWAQPRAEVIPNALEEVPPVGRAASSPDAARAPGPLIGCVGVISPQKRTLLFVEAAAAIAARLPAARFVVAGRAASGEEALLDRCRARAAELGLQSRFEWPGFLEEPASLYARLDLLIHAGVHEGFGRVVIEAMVHGVPVLVSDSGALPELVEDGATGRVVAADSARALADAAIELLEHAAETARMAEQARRRAADLYAPERHAAAVAGIYDRLLGAPAS